MSKLYVEYHRVKEGQHIVDTEALRDYCQIYQQDTNTVHEVLTGFDRVEYYMRDQDGKTVGAFFLTAMRDMHHGLIAVMAAHWLQPSARDREAHKLVMWYVKRFCQAHGIKKYQRTVNLSSSRQLIITKEI